MKKYAIVGASAAGLSCAKTLRALDADSEIHLFNHEYILLASTFSIVLSRDLICLYELILFFFAVKSTLDTCIDK